MIKLGLPAFFITINPADYHHPIVLHFADKKVNLDHPFSGNWLPQAERALLVAQDPVAAAKFFHTLVQLWLRTVLGITDGNVMNNIGVLGRASGYYGTVETQGRGSLHLHILVWIHGSKNPDEMASSLLDPTSSFSEDMKDYLRSVISEQFPEGDVTHWWHPEPMGRGMRTKFADDLLWLPYLTDHYLQVTGDKEVLKESCPFIEGPLLGHHEDEEYMKPKVSTKC